MNMFLLVPSIVFFFVYRALMRRSDRLTEGSRTAAIYGLTMVHERHGNRYEVDDAFLAPLHEVGVDFVGFSADGNYPEVFEIPAHPFYIGTIYHPEFLSRPNKAHPLFAAFIGAAAAHQA